MALLIRGETNCPICGLVIGAGQATVLFPHVVLNDRDVLHVLSDRACHEHCVTRDPLGQRMVALVEECLRRSGPGQRPCAVCGREITDPDDYLFIPYLTDRMRGALARFNYTHLHRSHVPHWRDREEFLAVLTEFIGSGAGGRGLSDLARDVARLSSPDAVQDRPGGERS